MAQENEPLLHVPAKADWSGARQEKAAPMLSALALSTFFEGTVPTFLINADHVITHWNKACEQMSGRSAAEMVGTCNQWQPFHDNEQPVLADLIISGVNDDVVGVYYRGKFKRSILIPNAYEAEDFFPRLGESGRWLSFSAAPLYNAEGMVIGAIQTLQDITERKLLEKDLHKTHIDLEHLVAIRTAQLTLANDRLEDDIRRREKAESELLRRNAELEELNAKLSAAQAQLMQSEKLASIGQLAAGVAHEINNPIGYIFSNFSTLDTYIAGLFDMLAAYEEAESDLRSPQVLEQLKATRKRVELEFLKEDIPGLMSESKEGITRVRKIVQDLKDFSHADANQEWQWINLHRGIDSTLNIVNNEVKYKADIVKEYGSIPEIECIPSLINQVVMNMVVNASHAIGPERGTITIRTGVAAGQDHVWIEVADTGSGISKENLAHIFDPFFTTKPVGQGTGLGLSLSYGIVQKHQGRIDVESELGTGTTFRITLPIEHPVSPDATGVDGGAQR